MNLKQHYRFLKKKSSSEFENIDENNYAPIHVVKYNSPKITSNPFFQLPKCKTSGLSKSVELIEKNPSYNAPFPTEDDTSLLNKAKENNKFNNHFESIVNKQPNLYGDQTIPSLTITCEEYKQSTVSITVSSLSKNDPIIVPEDLKQGFADIINHVDELYKLKIQTVPLVYFPKHNKKILVLDIDETLTHNLSLEESTPLTIHNIYFKTGEYARVVLRPNVKNFLDLLSKEFTLITFTAGMKKYAESVVRLIDPRKNYFLCELYRSDCNNVCNQYFVKDMRQIGDLSKIIIVDNCITSFSLQIDNGIKIAPFYGDPEDNELAKLAEYLLSIKDCGDVRIELQKKHHYSLYFDTFISNQNSNRTYK